MKWCKESIFYNQRILFLCPDVDELNFIPSCVDPGSKEWNTFRIQVINDLYEGSTMTFFKLSTKLCSVYTTEQETQITEIQHRKQDNKIFMDL